jgi:hypothetical protein
VYGRRVIFAGLAVIAATLVASRFSEAVDLLRFPICWAGVLLLLDGVARRRRGRSPLASAQEWIACGTASVLFWDVFELVDLRLRNWWYAGVSPSPLWSAVFGALSFATVLPAVRLALAILRGPETVGEQRSPALSEEVNAVHQPGRGALPLAALGLLMLALALAFPRWAFPLAWLFLWPLCEAACRLLPRRALSSPLESRAFVRTALLGLPLGLVWESLNWGCARGWVYTVPHVERWKLFEMPLPGYLGYLPFLLEATAALALLDRLRPHLRGLRGALAVGAVLLLHAGADALARGQTVVSFAPYDASGAAPDALALERRTHMGLARAEAVVARGWGALGDDPALVRLWMAKAR